MEQLKDEELARVKELLRHTGEFIAYFELAESKMMEWRHEIDQQVSRLDELTQSLQTELEAMQNLLTQSGAAHFRITAEKALAQGENNLQTLERSCTLFTENFQQQQEKLHYLAEQCLVAIETQGIRTTELIASKLAKYDVHQFHRIAHESCDHVERAAHAVVNKSGKLLSMFQLRFGLFAVFTTILTTFIMVLYLSGELPWELHHQVLNEREAGKILIQAWPNLSKEVKTKILRNDRLQHDG